VIWKKAFLLENGLFIGESQFILFLISTQIPSTQITRAGQGTSEEKLLGIKNS
jgi:hypothetical protein